MTSEISNLKDDIAFFNHNIDCIQTLLDGMDYSEAQREIMEAELSKLLETIKVLEERRWVAGQLLMFNNGRAAMEERREAIVH